MARRRNFTRDRLTPAGRWLQAQTKVLAGKPRVKIGILQRDFDDPKEDPNQPFTVGEVAVVNEFGTADRRIPERSFIRATTDEQKRRVNAMIAKAKLGVVAGFLPAKKVLGLVGVFMKGRIQNKIIMLRKPKNADSTILKKTRAGKIGNNPLIDTGQMRQKIDWVVQDGPNR